MHVYAPKITLFQRTSVMPTSVTTTCPSYTPSQRSVGSTSCHRIVVYEALPSKDIISHIDIIIIIMKCFVRAYPSQAWDNAFWWLYQLDFSFVGWHWCWFQVAVYGRTSHISHKHMRTLIKSTQVSAQTSCKLNLFAFYLPRKNSTSKWICVSSDTTSST